MELLLQRFFFLVLHLVELVLLAKFDTLFPAVVPLEKVGCDPSKFNQFMLLQALSQWDVVKVIISIDRCTQCLHKREMGLWKLSVKKMNTKEIKCILYITLEIIKRVFSFQSFPKLIITPYVLINNITMSYRKIFFNDEEVVKCLIHWLVVVILDRPKVRFNQRQLFHLNKETEKSPVSPALCILYHLENAIKSTKIFFPYYRNRKQ